jgi:hypothetical protein
LGFVSNPDQFDDEVVNYLQSEELQSDLESARDLMIDYVEKRSQQLQGGRSGGHDERKSSRDPRDGQGTDEDDDEGEGLGPGQGPGGEYLDEDYSQNDLYENDEGDGGDGDAYGYGGYQDDLLLSHPDPAAEEDDEDLYEDERRGYRYGGGEEGGRVEMSELMVRVGG